MDSFLTDAVPQASHFSYALYFAAFFVAARFFLDHFVYRRLAKWLLPNGRAQTIPNRVTQAKIAKCSESMWKLTYYGIVEVFVLWITLRESWSRDTKEYFKGWPNQELQLSVKLYYMCQCGFYLYSVVALQWWEARRKDYAVTMSHHVITVFLIGYSYITRFFRVGLVTLALHDASDVFLEAAKVFKYSDHDLAASVCFGLFAVSWLTLRLILFPLRVIKTTSRGDYLDLSKAFDKFLFYVFNTLLLMLLVFHIYWWILICSMISRQLKNNGRVGEDIRSDSEDDD